ncbi:urease accessory UreF family protein [Fulvimarina sp. 2208YS6-2-32]|uniref:Urease accessory protein UreF n=1 Tax=Fulvimarina uroteuthidis TaxID=3098149 RepID=A0ABU5I2I4_9HYPH|nr:urease accessory UreF family protein [Fulvimarina sp. 2208YS6-2-32]MDY8109029.1 urease accessory UreF family protein [Fulvimarina sp. 2208YS6-2-32]
MVFPLALLSWLSPVFPTGGFAYSGGLETAIAEERIATLEALIERTQHLVREGTLWNDAVLIACAFRAYPDMTALGDLALHAAALAGSAERLAETLDQGRSFAKAVTPWVPASEDEAHDMAGESALAQSRRDTPFPVHLGAAAAAHGVTALDTITVFLHAAVSAQLQAAIRLSLIGQTGAAKAMAALEPAILTTASRAADADLGDLGSGCLAAEIDSLRHAVLDGRLFLS